MYTLLVYETRCVKITDKKSQIEVFFGGHSGEKGWQKEKAHIAGQTEVVTLVPAGAVENHDKIIIQVATGDFAEEYLHAMELICGITRLPMAPFTV